MKFSYNWIKEYIPKLPTPEKLEELLILKSFEFESIKKFGDDYILDIKLPPNRFSDCSGHLGMAKEISAVLKTKIKEQPIKIKEDKELASRHLMVKINDKHNCPRYTARIMTDIKVGPSPKYIIERLEACGVQSINNIVDASNYVMLELGQPLHCFDYEKLAGDKIKAIIVRRAEDKEKFESLDDRKYELNKEVLVIADLKQALAIAGIKGGKATGIEENTTKIAIESANFDPICIRKTSKALNLTTDASVRFEKKVDPNLTEIAINRLASLIQEIADGKILKGTVDVYPEKRTKKALGFDLNKFYKIAGFEIPVKEVKNIFDLLGFKIIKQNKNTLFLEIPSQRLDIERPEDLVEEVLRLYDYNKIPDIMPVGTLVPAEKNENSVWKNKIKKSLATLGLNEVYLYSFNSESDLINFKIKPQSAIKLLNPVSSEMAYLRPTLLINLLKTSGNNFRFFDEVKIFELGKTFQKGAVSPIEEMRVAGLISRKDKKNHPFLELKGIIEKMFESFGLCDLEFHDLNENPWLISGRSAEIKVGEKSLGYIGEIASDLSQKYNDGFPAVVFEMDFEKVKIITEEEIEFEPICKFPAVIRDISMIIDENVRINEILNLINETEQKILRDVDLFDIYEGDKMPKGKKSLSFHLIFQSAEKTLTNDEIGKSLEKIISNLKSKLNAEIR